MHPLANDLTVPDALRRAFARVKHQIIRTYDDGSEGVINVNPTQDLAHELAEHRKRIGVTFDSGRMLVSVEVREV